MPVLPRALTWAFSFISLYSAPLIISSTPQGFKRYLDAEDTRVSSPNSTPNACWTSSPEVATGIPNSAHPHLNPPSRPTPNLLLFSPSLESEGWPPQSATGVRSLGVSLSCSLFLITTSKWSSRWMASTHPVSLRAVLLLLPLPALIDLPLLLSELEH